MATAQETIYNPLTTEEVTFVQTASDTGGKRGVFEILIGPQAKGPPLHYHPAFTETFEVLEGELAVRVGKHTTLLTVGDRLTVASNQPHTFWSVSSRPTRFRGTIEPANVEFENCFRISFGLARDGLMTRNGMPRRLSHLAILATMSQSNLSGPASLLSPLFRLMVRTRSVAEVRDDLVRRYCPLTP